MKKILWVLTLLFILIPFISFASAYWMEIKGSGKIGDTVKIQVCYGFIDAYSIRNRDKGTEFNLIQNFNFFVINTEGKKTPLKLEQKSDYWEGVFIPQTEGCYRILGINNQNPVIDRSENDGKNIRPIDYLCGMYSINCTTTTTTNPHQFLDIILQKKEEIYLIHTFQEGKPVTDKSSLRIFNPENWEKTISLNKEGQGFFKPTMNGLYIIRRDWYDNLSGNYKGKSYSSIRYRYNYCIWIQIKESN